MSDAINDVEKETEASRLAKVKPELAAKKLRDLRPVVMQYKTIVRSLEQLGYVVEENGNRVKVWKAI